MNKIIFLEGPAFSGKTTFLHQASDNCVRIPEASEFLGGDFHFPDAPTDAKTMAYCSYFFAVMENKRFELIGDGIQDDVVLVDRFTPLSSMIFYALRHANGDIKDADYELGKRLSSAIFNQTVRLPVGSCKFLRFNLSSPEILSKRLPRGTRNEELASWRAFEFYSNWYQQVLPSSTEEVLDSVYNSDLQNGSWARAGTLLPLIMNSDTVTDEEIERYLPQSTKRAIEARVEKLLQKADAV